LDFSFADFEIDLAQHELRRKGEIIPIEPQVFDLLIHLIRRRDRIVSKEELIEAVWQGPVISEAALSSCVAAARRSIGDNGDDQRFIRTHHKRGFRFVGQVEALVPLPEAANSVRGHEGRNEAIAPVLALPDRPSIAVLPFQNMSGDPEQEYFADGLTDDIITGLSHQRWFFVIARNSSFTFKGEAIDVRKVASELGVRYVLEGSVRKAAGRARVNAQLIERQQCRSFVGGSI
jgi:TolB-like protein